MERTIFIRSVRKMLYEPKCQDFDLERPSDPNLDFLVFIALISIMTLTRVSAKLREDVRAGYSVIVNLRTIMNTSVHNLTLFLYHFSI